MCLLYNVYIIHCVIRLVCLLDMYICDRSSHDVLAFIKEINMSTHISERTTWSFQVAVIDRDIGSPLGCWSINDPHIRTFDGT